MVGQLLHRWLTHCEGFYRKDGEQTSEVGVCRAAARFVRELYIGHLANEFRPSHLRAVRGTMIDAGLARSTINALVRRVRACWRWGVGQELIPETVYRALGTVEALTAGRSAARETADVQPVAIEIVEATLPHLSPTVATMVRVQLWGAMRPQDVCGLTPGEVDRSALPWAYRPGRHKTQHRGKTRVICLGPKAREALTPWLEACTSPEAWVFRTTRGNQWTKDTYWQSLRAGCKKAGVERWNPHRLRHSMATAIRAKYGAEAAQVALGVSSLAVAEIYAERDAVLAARVIEDLG